MKKCGCLDKYLKYYDVKCGMNHQCIKDDAQHMQFAEKMYVDIYGTNTIFERYIESCAIRDEHRKANKMPALGLFPKLKQDMLEAFLSTQNKSCSYNDTIEPERQYIADLVYTFTCSRSKDPIQ